MRIWLLIFSFLFIQNAFSQKYLQIEKYGSYKLIKFFPGSTLKFTFLEDPDEVWHTRAILDVDADKQELVFHDRMVNLTEIGKIEINKRNFKKIGKTLVQFSLSWWFYMGVDNLVFNNKSKPIHYKVGGGSALLGGLFWLVRKEKVYDMGRKWRVRIINTDMLFRN
jgi:hypothetical protein